MLYGNIIGWNKGKDDLFNPTSERNRDNCLEPMRRLKKYAKILDIELHTPDITDKLSKNVDFNLYVEALDITTAGTNYLLVLELELIVPRLGDINYLKKFDLVFTWNNLIVDGEKFIKIYYPNTFAQSKNDGFKNRPIFACMIAGNKFTNILDSRELYSERVKIIRWFEKNNPQDFELYGVGWEKPARKKGGISKLLYRIEKFTNYILSKSAFPSYKGSVISKSSVYDKARFSICYENARDFPGYITEKIFDSFFSGCVPVYWGDPQINLYIDENCFIDKRDFMSLEDLYLYLKNMPEKEYIDKQLAIKNFLNSNKFNQFSSENFSKTVLHNIIKNQSKQYKNFILDYS